jgi:CDP-paratose 2-epimerase
MSIAVITGSAGLVGSEAVRRFHELGYDVWGIDNDLRRRFFGAEASTRPMAERLVAELPRYRHHDHDVRDRGAIAALFEQGGGAIEVVIHAAAQPSHDWAATDPFTDFSVNAEGTLVVLEAVREHSPDASFLFLSTNKVYGDRVNALPLEELATRWELPEDHAYHPGIPESFPIDGSLHSLFGVSKASADLMVQEYGRYFGLRTVCFRAGCLTGPGHAGAELHGFLAYLVKCAVSGSPYRVFGHLGKQVRDNIHSADLVAAFELVVKRPPCGAVYNIGGGRHSHCSMLEAIELVQEISGRELAWSYSEESRQGDHRWWISDLAAFRRDYPEWTMRHDLESILREIHDAHAAAWSAAAG